MNSKSLRLFIISTFVGLYVIVSVISTIHVIDFFRLSNPNWLAVSLALAFEVGAAASLASLIVLDRMNKFIIWTLFILLTLMQAMGNTYYAYTHLSNFNSWVELFGLVEDDIIYQKRMLSLISGAILPIVSLGFIKSLIDYIRPESVAVNTDSNIEIDEPDYSEYADPETNEPINYSEYIEEMTDANTGTDPVENRNFSFHSDPTRLQ